MTCTGSKVRQLDKVDGNHSINIASINNSQKYKITKQKMKTICTELCYDTNNYSPDKTLKTIKVYVDEKNKLDRILYSEISNNFFSLDVETRGIFTTNLEKLLMYALNENGSSKNLNEDVRKIVIKLYDHIQLVSYQIENVNNIFENGIIDTKEGLRVEVKSIEKEYITILGIFASIVLTFSAGVSFSTSTLSNLADVPFARLFIVVDFLAMILVTSIYMLVNLIKKINTDKNINYLFICIFNIIAFLIMIAIIAISNFCPNIFSNL